MSEFISDSLSTELSQDFYKFSSFVVGFACFRLAVEIFYKSLFNSIDNGD